MRVGIYVRVSTSDQNTELQKREIAEYLKARGWMEVKLYEDIGRTGTNGDRPELKRLLTDAKGRKIDVVIVWKLDRLFRSLKDLVNVLGEWDALGIKFISLKDQLDLGTASGRLLMQVIGAMAEFEAALIRERVRGGLLAARAKGRIGGRKKLRDDTAIRQLRDQGLSLRQIATTLGISKGSVQASLRGLKTLKVPGSQSAA